jgi:hypothetical protein
MKFRINRSWYICPVEVEGKGSFQTNMGGGPGIYDLPLVKDIPGEQFLYVRSTFSSDDGEPDFFGTVELLREVVEIIEKAEGEDGWQLI